MKSSSLEGLGCGYCASRDINVCVLCRKLDVHFVNLFQSVFKKRCFITFLNVFCWCFFHTPFSSNNTECFRSETYLLVRSEHSRKVDNQESKQKIVGTFPLIRSRAQCGPETIHRSYWTAVFLPAHKPAGALHPLLRKNSL